MAYFDVYLDLRRQRLVWLPNLLPTSEKSFAKKLRCDRDQLRPQAIHLDYQVEVYRRQKLFDIADARTADGRRSGKVAKILLESRQVPVVEPNNDILNIVDTRGDQRHHSPDSPPTKSRTPKLPAPTTIQEPVLTNPTLPPRLHTPSYRSHDTRTRCEIVGIQRSFKQAYDDELKTNSQYYIDELCRLVNTSRIERYKLQYSCDYTLEPLAKVNIVEISAIAFHLNLKYKDNELFSTTLYKLDREIE